MDALRRRLMEMHLRKRKSCNIDDNMPVNLRKETTAYIGGKVDDAKIIIGQVGYTSTLSPDSDELSFGGDVYNHRGQLSSSGSLSALSSKPCYDLIILYYLSSEFFVCSCLFPSNLPADTLCGIMRLLSQHSVFELG